MRFRYCIAAMRCCRCLRCCDGNGGGDALRNRDFDIVLLRCNACDAAMAMAMAMLFEFAISILYFCDAISILYCRDAMLAMLRWMWRWRWGFVSYSLDRGETLIRVAWIRLLLSYQSSILFVDSSRRLIAVGLESSPKSRFE